MRARHLLSWARMYSQHWMVLRFSRDSNDQHIKSQERRLQCNETLHKCVFRWCSYDTQISRVKIHICEKFIQKKNVRQTVNAHRYKFPSMSYPVLIVFTSGHTTDEADAL